jgi:uncharacterized protein YecT (DUF1311 family)
MCQGGPVRRALEKAMARSVAMGAGGLVCFFLANVPLGAQPEEELDPCADVFGQQDLNACWAREVERAEEELNQVYLALRQKLPPRGAESLDNAQKLWLEFREAHIGTLYGVESPAATYGRDYPMCLSISRTALTRARTRQLRRLLDREDETVCPL